MEQVEGGGRAPWQLAAHKGIRLRWVILVKMDGGGGNGRGPSGWLGAVQKLLR